MVVQVDPVFVMSLAHLAQKGLPIYSDAEVIDHSLDLLRQPLLQAEQVDVSHRANTFAWSYEGVRC